MIEDFLQPYIKKNSSVLDIGGGYCEFINQIQAQEKYLIDLNPDAKIFADSNVKVLNINILKMNKEQKFEQKFDAIFVSNFFEHLFSAEEVLSVLIFCFDHLRGNGSLLVIQPNFKYSYKEYYDFIDHTLPITHHSFQEILETVGFKVEVLIPRFLPFSTKGRPTSSILLKIYLKLPFLWNILGGQFFLKASKPANHF